VTAIRVIRIDGSITVGGWLGCTDQGDIEVGRGAGAETIPFNDLMRVTFGLARLAENPDRLAENPVSVPHLVGRARGPDTKESTVDIYPTDGGFMRGEIVRLPRRPLSADKGADAVVVHCPLGDNVVLPFERLAGIQFADGATYTEEAKLFLEALSDRLPGHDVLVTRGADNARTLRGTLEELGPGHGLFALTGSQNVRTFRLVKIFGVVFAAGAYKQPTYPLTVELVDGSVFSGQIRKVRRADHPTQARSAQRTLPTRSLRITSSLGVDVDVPVMMLAEIRCHSDRVVYLSDLTPKAQRIEGRMHRPWPVKLDRSVSGRPIMLSGERFEKGLGVHSRTELDYELAGGYETFVATLGIDDGVRPRGSVVFRILGDGEVLYETAMLTGTSEPHLCRVDVTGVTLLTLVVDYGDSLDLADHADWGGARLLKDEG
jgi:hypothetical protein